MKSREFLERFANFNDGVIEEIHISWSPKPGLARFVIQAQDQSTEGIWARVELKIHDVRAFRLTENQKESYQVIFDDVSINERADGVLITFDDLPARQECQGDAIASQFYVLGGSYTWNTL